MEKLQETINVQLEPDQEMSQDGRCPFQIENSDNRKIGMMCKFKQK